MKTPRSLASLSALIALALATAIPSVLRAQIYSSCDQWGNITTNGYTVYNNIWGSGAGSQCLTVNSFSNWFVDANHPNTSGIKSYPNVERKLSLNVDTMGALSSSFAVTRPSGGAYSSTYDIWYNNYAYEVMLWMNYTGPIGPIASAWDANGNPIAEATNVSVGGHTWNVYKGSNGSNAVFSFLRTSNTNSGTVDITAISQWIKNRGWFGNANLHSVQFGFEITSSNGNQRYSVTNFSVTSGGSSSSLTVSPTSQSFGSSASSQSASITSNVSWTASDNQSWITVSPTSGSNNATLNVSVTQNTGTTSRSGTVTVTGGGLTRTIAVSQAGAGTTADTYPAESAPISGTGTVYESTNGGYHGTGYVNFGANSGTLTFNNVDGNGGGTKNLAIRYALGVTAARTCNLVVNGVTRSVTFQPTGAWTTWQTLSVSIALNNNSTNTIRFATTGSDAGNIDEITVP